ncbi:MAG: transcriptional regulator [Bacteroidetes bacterium]|nr:transcriptional regulator [Bacteroidota bacterium]
MNRIADLDAVFKVVELDRLVHEPARHLLLAHLSVVEEADFTYLLNATGLSSGNISSHMAKLEEAGYVAVRKGFSGKRPLTTFSLTKKGRGAFDNYRRNMRQIVN